MSVLPALGRALVIGVGCLALANCASSALKTSARSKDPKYGVYASPRVVDSGGEAIDPSVSRRGVYMVGKPYSIAGKRYVPRENKSYAAVGRASWYGDDFHGRLTANGEVFDMHDISAAHATMPLPSYARVTNVENGSSIVVRVNDRGPYHGGRIIDVSRRTAELLDFRSKGVGRVKVEYLGRAPTTVADAPMLLATLRNDGSAAPMPAFDGGRAPVMVADASPALPPAPPGREPAQDATAMASATPVLAPAAPILASMAPAQPATSSARTMLAAYAPEPAGEMGDTFAAGDVERFFAKVVVPPERPAGIDGAGGQPVDQPSGLDRSAPAPATAVPLPPQRNAGLEGPAKLTVADIVSQAKLQAGPGAVLAFMAMEQPAVRQPRLLYVDAGSFADEASAEEMRWVLAQASDATIVAMETDEGTRFRVQAGPVDARAEAAAILTLARSAGAADAAIVE